MPHPASTPPFPPARQDDCIRARPPRPHRSPCTPSAASSPSARGGCAKPSASVAASLPVRAQTRASVRSCERDCSRELGRGAGRGQGSQDRHRAPLAGSSPQHRPASTSARRSRLEPRYRGIFKVNGYVHERDPDCHLARWHGARAACRARRLTPATASRRGCCSRSAIRAACAAPRSRSTAPRPSCCPAPPTRRTAGACMSTWPRPSPDRPSRYSVQIALELVGTGELAFAPVGEATHVELASDWPHPSFAGRFLPLERTVDESGFRALWQLNALATTAPQEAAAGSPACAFGDTRAGRAARARARPLHRILRRRPSSTRSAATPLATGRPSTGCSSSP